MPKFAAKLRRRQLDKSLLPLKEVPRLPRGYIHEIRNALEMTTRQLAERLGISQPSVIDLEKNEHSGSITLRTLENAAEALGCRVVYAVVPKESLEAVILNQARRNAREIVQSVGRSMALEKQATEQAEQDQLIEDLAAELVRKGGSALWKIVDER
ncbi:MAG: transcriptional regulator [Cyanobacteria bacterium DS2.3.42]|nr:transcriptional regulator [Cyanobacteria bacterium DS2.3.42]